MSNLISPATDAGVFALAAATISCAAVGAWVARRIAGAPWLIVGIGTAALALQALRALH